MKEKIVVKPYKNKRNKQLTLVIPKKSLPPTLRYSPNLFFELRAFKSRIN